MSQKKTSVGNSSIGNMFGSFKKKLLGSNDKPKAKDVSKDAATKTPVGLFTPIKIGDIGVAKNRIALAPMTRDRATVDGVVGKYQAEFYAQRANAGLEITEGCQISAQGVGWWCAPSFFTKEQISAWKPVVQAVHDNNGLLVLQLWHLGRASHSDYFQELAKAANVEKILPVAPSEIAINGDGIYVPGWAKKPHEVPRALETDEIVGVIESFVAAAKAAIDEVGFDGVEIHGANGYLIDEFLQSKTNKREDKYGGSIENRVRFVDELLAAMVKEIPASKIGIRYSPNAVYNDTGSPDNLETFDKAIEVAASYNIAYIHVVDGLAFGFHNLSEAYTLKRAKDVIAKVQNGNVVTSLMGNCGYTKETAEEKIKAGDTDMISFGRDYISNPDLAIRFEKNLELAPPAEYKFYYIPNAEDPGVGYTDFPAAKKE